MFALKFRLNDGDQMAGPSGTNRQGTTSPAGRHKQHRQITFLEIPSVVGDMMLTHSPVTGTIKKYILRVMRNPNYMG